MSVTVTWHPDHRGLAELYSTEGQIGRAVRGAADRTVSRAKTLIGTSPRRVRTGQMRTKVHRSPLASQQQRIQASVISPVFYARYQEFGTRHITPALHLTRAAQQLTLADYRPY